jgi:hypothetical protein
MRIAQHKPRNLGANLTVPARNLKWNDGRTGSPPAGVALNQRSVSWRYSLH